MNRPMYGDFYFWLVNVEFVMHFVHVLDTDGIDKVFLVLWLRREDKITGCNLFCDQSYSLTK
jgi:hypothetical protein